MSMLMFVMIMRMLVAMIMIVTMVMMPVIMVMMVVAVFVLQMNVKFSALDLKSFRTLRMQVITVDVQLLELVLELVKINAEVQHRADKHIAADAAEDVEKEGFHSAWSSASALIWLAAKPAPKPLSMLTTVTPLPQLLSMASNAVMPPKCAP